MRAENTDDGFRICISIPKSSRQWIDAAVNSAMEMFIDFISEMLDVSICSIMLGDDLTGELTIKNARGLNSEIINRTRIRIGDSIAGWVVMEGRLLFIENVEADPRFMRKNINQYDTKSLISIPLKIHDKAIGVINLNNKKGKAPFTAEDFLAASMLSERVSLLLEKFYSGNFNEDALNKFLTSFENFVAMGKKYPKKISSAAPLIFKIMEKLEATADERKMAVYIAMVYDLGLAPMDEEITKKQLTPQEKHKIEGHPLATISLLSEFEFSDAVKDAILHHHENFDGTGYPDGLRGDAIPFISRVLHVVDAFCAMTTEKPYRPARSAKDALKEIRKNAGSYYDPAVVSALEDVLTSA
jgi:putative methionine-R-sulfoxide reductase with GAF domain